MKFSAELDKIRRYLRDPDGNIWNTDLLIDLYNQAQQDLQNETRVLEDISIVMSPPRWDCSYLHDCELEFATGLAYHALRHNQNFFTYCAHFEAQENFLIAADVTDTGDCAYIHPFEAWYVNPNKPVEFPFPDHFHSALGMYYDEQYIEFRSKKDISRQDPSFMTHSGTTQWYYREDDYRNTFTPYPRPSTATWNDEEGTGMVTDIDGDTVGSETGIITQRTGSLLSNESGLAVTALETEDNFTIYHDVAPYDVAGPGDDLIWPDFLVKYVRYRVLELAYMTDNDGRIVSLGNYWSKRYQLGLMAVKKYMANRRRDREYRFRTQSAIPVNQKRHPRLPDTFPAI
jgi:hypothetical protein